MTTTTEQTLRELLTVMWLDGHIELTDGPDDIADVVTVGEAAINAALDARPNNRALRELYADWLEVQGDARAESQRWMVEPHNFSLVFYSTFPEPWTIHVDATIVEHLTVVCTPPLTNTMHYPTRTAAELDLHNALVKAGEITCEEVTA